MKLSKTAIVISILSVAVIGLVVALVLTYLPGKKEPALRSGDFSSSSQTSTQSSSSSSSATPVNLTLKQFDMATKTFTGDFGSLTLTNVTKVTEQYDDSRDEDLKIAFSLRNTSSGDITLSDVVHQLILQQDEGVFDKAERLEPVDLDDYHEFNENATATNLTTKVAANATVDGFVIYELESPTQPIQFLLSNGEKVFEFKP